MHFDPLHHEASVLLQSRDLGDVGHSEYDAAWVARVPRPDRPDSPAFPEVLEEIRRRQAADGGWEKDVPYVSTRIQTTLASCLALLQFPGEPSDIERAHGGAQFADEMWKRLAQDPEPALGFELVIASLVEEGCRRGLPLEHLRSESRAIQQKKLARVSPELIYSPKLSIGFSLEFMLDGLDAEKALQLRVANGSLGDSVAATAHHARLTGDPTSYAFIHGIVASYGPSRIPYAAGNLWGTIWTLYNFDLADLLPNLGPLAAPHVEHIRRHVHQEGVSWSAYVAYGDGDDTAVGLRILHRSGIPVDWGLLRQYERDDGFLTFRAESHPSISTNANVLTAISSCPYEGSRETCDKLIRLLVAWRNDAGFWTDKWHASPLYPTSRAAIALNLATRGEVSLLRPTIDWLLKTQRSDGSWGFFENGTAEETAYAIYALASSRRAGFSIASSIFERADAYLASAYEAMRSSEHPKLWIAKSLYGPTNVIRAAVIGARALIRDLAGPGERFSDPTNV